MMFCRCALSVIIVQSHQMQNLVAPTSLVFSAAPSACLPGPARITRWCRVRAAVGRRGAAAACSCRLNAGRGAAQRIGCHGWLSDQGRILCCYALQAIVDVRCSNDDEVMSCHVMHRR